jgi:hypothetical protein
MDPDESRDVLQLDTILGTIASALLKSDFESNKPILRKPVELNVYNDPTMGNNVAEMIDTDTLHLNPVQYDLLRGTYDKVLSERSKWTKHFHMKQGLGSCFIKEIAMNNDFHKSLCLSFVITNVMFDDCCYFGKNYCGNKKRERVWARDQYCKPFLCSGCEYYNACSCCPKEVCSECSDE